MNWYLSNKKLNDKIKTTCDFKRIFDNKKREIKELNLYDSFDLIMEFLILSDDTEPRFTPNDIENVLINFEDFIKPNAKLLEINRDTIDNIHYWICKISRIKLLERIEESVYSLSKIEHSIV
ncbi:hypothetical protein MTR05_12980 [Staphylococcus agnetis]|uniref:hypothetical protein n=1 Tax=Staphylococcus agnetis TaxID=985762 RepID=UPI00208E9186|nr:hypothetical protein [Staphylococcus agnetis]MCO4327929.1 hypothetical protein [Staphylococcus agnetis]